MTLATPEDYKDALRRIRGEGEDWLMRRDRMIRDAREAGLSLRDIGGSVGLSYAGVDKIVKESRVQDRS
jgi:hypothetical protein